MFFFLVACRSPEHSCSVSFPPVDEFIASTSPPPSPPSTGAPISLLSSVLRCCLDGRGSRRTLEEGKSGDSSGTSAPARIMVRKALIQESCGCLILNITIFGRV